MSAEKERAPSAQPSAFETRYMQTAGKVLLRDHRVSRLLAVILGVAGLFVMSTGVFIASVNETSQKPLPATAVPFVVGALTLLGIGIGVLGLMLSVLRTVVTDEEILIRFGFWGPRIAMANVVSAKAVDYHFTEYGGWGIRLGRDGSWAYVPSGRRAVEIRYREGTKVKRVLVGVEDPEGTAATITTAAAKYTTTRTRVKTPEQDADSAAIEAEAEAELEAELAEQRTEDRSQRD